MRSPSIVCFTSPISRGTSVNGHVCGQTTKIDDVQNVRTFHLPLWPDRLVNFSECTYFLGLVSHSSVFNKIADV